MKKLSILLTFSIFLLFGCLSCREDSNQQEKKESTEKISRPLNTSSGHVFPQGTTRLHHASNSGNTNEARKLISEGADVNAKTEYGGTPLHFVSECCGNAEIAKLLIEAGADVNARDHFEYTPLNRATSFRKVEIVKVFIEAGAYVCAKDHPKNIVPLLSAKHELAYGKRHNFEDYIKNATEVIKLLEAAMKKQGCLEPKKETHPASK